MATAKVSGMKVARERTAVGRFATEYRLAGLNLLVAFIALAVAGLMGVTQALEYNKINLYPALSPVVRGYYHGLALHGVLNVLVFTTFYIMGFLTFIATRAFNRPLASPRHGWVTFGVMVFSVIFIINALSYFPALALGPIAEYFSI